MGYIKHLTWPSIVSSLDTKDIVIKYFVIILLGGAIFYLDGLEITNGKFNTILIIAIAVAKTCYFSYESLKKISFVINKSVPYFRFLIFMMVNVILFIFSFGIDYFCLNQVDPTHFSGVPETAGNIQLIFEFFYISVLGFNNLGFYDLIPISVASKFLVMVEIPIYYFSIILILSDFISLRDSIIQEKMRKIQKAKE